MYRSGECSSNGHRHRSLRVCRRAPTRELAPRSKIFHATPSPGDESITPQYNSIRGLGHRSRCGRCNDTAPTLLIDPEDELRQVEGRQLLAK